MSLKGPWLESSHSSQTGAMHTNFVPIIQHQSNTALKPSTWTEESADGGPQHNPQHLPQSVCRLYLRYGQLSTEEMMAEDPFYALNELFYFFASTERTYLNMIRAKFERETLPLENTTNADETVELAQTNL